MSNNWVVENIQNAIDTWNDKFAEIWRLLSQSPEEFKGGAIWNVMVGINGALKAIGYALLVLFFLMGIMKHYNSMQEIKRPEQALKLFIRFVLAKHSDPPRHRDRQSLGLHRMSNTKKKYGVRISVLEYGYYEVEAESKEEAEAKAEEKIAEGNVCWGDFEITDSTAEEVRKEKARDVGDR